MESLENFVLKKQTSFEMLSIRSAGDIAIALISAPDPFSISAKLADSFYMGDVATIILVLPFIAKMIQEQENLNDRDSDVLFKKVAVIVDVMKSNGIVKTYWKLARLRSNDELQKLVTGYFDLVHPFHQYAYILDNREMLSPSVDFYLANMAFHAHMNDDYESEKYFQSLRYDLTKSRKS